jgi:alpha-beta hydrolase superfamily lysophospholipase
MIAEEFTLIANDSTKVFVYAWLPDAGTKIRGVLQIAHGMAEHAERYSDFAKYLTANGYAIYANDHRGHGKTAGSVTETGYIAQTNSWKAILEDMFMLNRHIREKYPDHKLILMGHSMGSFYARAYLEMHTESINALILSGTAWHPSLLLNFGLLVAKLQCAFKGLKNHSNLLDTLSFGAFNKKFEPVKTPFDWLSRNNHICTLYTADPYCGFVCTSSFFRELFRVLKFVHKRNLYAHVNKKFPVLIFSGSMDPVGDFAKGPKAMYAFLKNKGFTDLSLNIYSEGRHEMLNEINHKEVYKDCLLYTSPSPRDRTRSRMPSSA